MLDSTQPYRFLPVALAAQRMQAGADCANSCRVRNLRQHRGYTHNNDSTTAATLAPQPTCAWLVACECDVELRVVWQVEGAADGLCELTVAVSTCGSWVVGSVGGRVGEC